MNIALILFLAVPIATSGCSQQEYLRGYYAGMDHQTEYCSATRRIDNLECQSDLTETKANLKICQGVLDMYKTRGTK